MFRKIFIVATILILTLILGTVVFADSNFSKQKADETSIFELTKNLDDTKTFEKELVVSGRAKEGSNITLSVYVYKAVTVSTPTLLNKLEDTKKYDWVLSETKNWNVGASGIFARKVNLGNGKNRLDFTIKDKTGNIKKESIEMTLVDKEKVKDDIMDEMGYKKFERIIKEK